MSLGSLPNPMRRRYSLEFKRRVVQESMASGASIAGVAMAHGLNANQLHNWRWQYRRGGVGPLSATPALVPIHITGAPTVPQVAQTTPTFNEDHSSESGRIEIYLGSAKIVLHGAVDMRALQGAIELLRP